MADARLLKIKATLKKRQPKFFRQGSHKLLRVKKVWRSPKGLHSKMKDSRRGYRVKLQSGYMTPKAVRGLDKHGHDLVTVHSAAQLEKLDPKQHTLILLGGLGGRKKLAILEQAHTKKFLVQNAQPEATIKSIKEKLSTQRSEKEAREKAKNEKQKKAAEKAEKSKLEEKAEKAAEHKHEGAKHDVKEQTSEEKEKHKILNKKQ